MAMVLNFCLQSNTEGDHPQLELNNAGEAIWHGD